MTSIRVVKFQATSLLMFWGFLMVSELSKRHATSRKGIKTVSDTQSRSEQY